MEPRIRNGGKDLARKQRGKRGEAESRKRCKEQDEAQAG